MAKIKIDAAGFVNLRVYVIPRDKPMDSYLQFKVDSGANSTTISKAKLHELGYDDEWIKQGKLLKGKECPSTATGEVITDCYRVVVPEIRLGIWTGRNWSFLVRLNDDEKQQFRLLFGTDSMRFFNWFFDYKNGVCDYDGLVDTRYPLFNQQEQSIHSVDDILEEQNQ